MEKDDDTASLNSVNLREGLEIHLDEIQTQPPLIEQDETDYGMEKSVDDDEDGEEEDGEEEDVEEEDVEEEESADHTGSLGAYYKRDEGEEEEEEHAQEQPVTVPREPAPDHHQARPPPTITVTKDGAGGARERTATAGEDDLHVVEFADRRGGERELAEESEVDVEINGQQPSLAEAQQYATPEGGLEAPASAPNLGQKSLSASLTDISIGGKRSDSLTKEGSLISLSRLSLATTHPLMQDGEGKPPKKLFREDSLHQSLAEEETPLFVTSEPLYSLTVISVSSI